MATDTDLVASKAAALRLAQEMGCSGAHQHPDGKWMPCATMKEYEELVKKDKKNTVRVVEQRRRYRNSKGKNKRDWEPLAERGITAIDTIAGGGLVSGSVKVAPWAPDEEDPDVFSNPRLARRRSRQLGCIGVSRRVSRSGNVVWMPCSNMTDYAKRTGSTAFGRNFQRRRARRTLERAVAREVRRQLRRKKSLMEELYEGKALGRKLNRARVAATTPFNRDARDADMDMLVQEGTVWERPATPRVPDLPRVPGLRSRRDADQREFGKEFEDVSTEDLAREQEFIRSLRVGGIDLRGYTRAGPGGVTEGSSQYYAPRVRADVERMKEIYGREDLMAARLKKIEKELELRGWDDLFRGEGTRREEIRDMSIRQLRSSDVHPDVYEPLENTFSAFPDDDPIWDMPLREIARVDQGSNNLYFSDRDIQGMIDTDAKYRDGTPGSSRGGRGFQSRRESPAGGWRFGPRTGRRRAERGADRLQRRRNLERDRRAFERDMRDPRINPPVTETEIDEMAEYYEFAEATGAFKSVRGFKLTEEEQRDLSESEKAAKYRKATLDAVGEEHRGKPVRRVHWVYGAPGSGKTAKTNLGHLAVPDTSEAAHTNPDDYKRFHSLWNYGDGSLSTHEWSRRESAKTVRDALNEGMDVVVQGTGKDGLLMNGTIFEDGDYRKGRRSDTASVMHYLHVPDDERSRRIADRRTNQRRRYGAEPEDAMNVLDQVVKFIEEGRVDETHIYDNSGPIDESPPLVATFKDGNLVIYDEEKFDEIFNPIDRNGQPTVFRGPVADRPQVTRYSRRDDPRRGKTYAERLREEGENPGGFRKWDEEQREQEIREREARRAKEAAQAETRRLARERRDASDPDSYRGSHQAPTKSQEGGDTLDNLTNMLPLREGESNRDRVRLYGSSGSDPEYRRANGEMEAVFDAVTDKPDEIITVYRAVPSSRDASENDQINPGDWVSPSLTYAAIHGEGPLRGEYDIVETRVRAGDLVSEGNSLYEFGWDPEPDPVRLSYYTALDGLTEKEAKAVVDLLGPRGFRSHRDDVRNSKANRGIERVGGDASSYTLKKGNDDYDRMVKVGYVFEPITGNKGHSGGVFPPDRVLDSIRGWALEQGLQGADDLEPHPRTPLDGTILPPFIPEEYVEKVIEKIYRNHYDRIGDQNRIKRKGFNSFVEKLKAGQLPKTVGSGENTIDWNAMVPLEPDDIVLINDEHWAAINEVLKDYGITPDLSYIQDYGQRNNSPSKKKSKDGNKDDAHHGTLRWLRAHLKGPTRGVFRDERDPDDGEPIRTVITDEIIDEDMERIAGGKEGWLGAVPMSSQTKGARLSDYTKLGYERNRDNPLGPRMLYSFGQGDVNGKEHWTAGAGPYRQGGDLQTRQQKTLNGVQEDLDDLAKIFGEAGALDPETQDLLDNITIETKRALKQSHEGPLSEERMKQIDDALAEALAAAYDYIDDDNDNDNGGGGSGGLASRRDDDGESLQDAYRRHLKATRSLTQSEQAFEEQYGYELSSGDGDCYSASYRAAMELVEKGVDVDGDPITNVRVVVGSPIFPAIGNRSGHAWVEYDVVKPPPPVMSSADTERAREQILELVEEMGLPPKQKQATIDSFVEAIDRANEANASMPARDVTMVRDYASVRDGDEILEFDDMDRGRLEELKPDMTRDEYYAAGEMEEVDIAGRFSPAEYEETQVGLFGDNFYDGDATFLTRKQVDDHLEDMGIDGGLESKRSDDADAEDVRLHDEAIEQLREIFAEAGAEQSDAILDQLAYEMRTSPRGMTGGDRTRPIKPEHLEAIRELVDERDPEFMEDLVESQRIRQTTAGYRRLTESGLDSGVGVHDRETTTRVRGVFDAHIEDGDPITLYHGGPVDLTGDVDYEVSRNDSGQWGPGIYTTSSAFPAIKGWANPWQRNAEGGYDTVDPGHLHTTRWKGENPPRILDVMDPLPDDVLDEVVLPAIEALLREVKTFSRAERKDNWKIEWLEEELEATPDFIADKRGEVTGPETLLQLQKYMQESDVKYGSDGFLPSDRVDLIRNQMNAAIKDLGYDVIKSHEVGIREMSRTDYMFLDPDMVEFVDVATTHSLGGFGNAAQGEMAETVRRRVKAMRVEDAEPVGLQSRRPDHTAVEDIARDEGVSLEEAQEILDGAQEIVEQETLQEMGEVPKHLSDLMTTPAYYDTATGVLIASQTVSRVEAIEIAREEARYHPQVGFPEPGNTTFPNAGTGPPTSRQELWDRGGKLYPSEEIDLMELETYHSLLGKYLDHKDAVRADYKRLWEENDIQVSGYPTWVTDRLYHRPLDTPTKTTLPVRYERPGMEDPDETRPGLLPADLIAYAEKMQAQIVEDFFAHYLGEDWRDTDPDAHLMPDGTQKGVITPYGLNYSETVELFQDAELIATHHDTFVRHWQNDFEARKEYAKTNMALRQVRREHRATGLGEEGEFDLGVESLEVDNFRGTIATDRMAVISTLEDTMLLIAGHPELSKEQLELLVNASEIIFSHSPFSAAEVAYSEQIRIAKIKDKIGDWRRNNQGVDVPLRWREWDEDAVAIFIPEKIRSKVKSAGAAHIADHLTPEENDAIDAAFGTAGAGDSNAFARGNAAFLIDSIHETWAEQSAGYASRSLILQLMMARNLGWDDQRIADDLFHGVDTSGVFGHEDTDLLAPAMARGGITYSEIKERAAAVIEGLGDSMLTNVDDRSGRIRIRRDSATGNWIAEETTTGEIWEAPDLEQIERITGLTAAAEDVARPAATLGLTFRESAKPFEQLDRRIGLVLDDLDADSVAEEVRLGRELLGLRRGAGALLTPAERRLLLTEKPEDPDDPGFYATHPDDIASPRDVLFALKYVLPFTPEKLKDGATMAEARRIKKAYERVRAHRAARDNARHMVTALVYEHYVGDAFKAALAAERRTTAERLKEMGIETIPLYRGFSLGKDDADALLSALGDTGASHDDHMMPLTSWSTSKQTGIDFAEQLWHDETAGVGRTGFLVKSDVPVDDIVGLSINGFGCLTEGECVVGHGERHLTIEKVY